MASLALGVKFNPASAGTADFVYSSAVAGYVGPAATSPAMADGKTYRYRAESADLSQWEFGYGVYTAATQTIARSTIQLSSTGAKVSFTVPPQVGVTAFPADVLLFDDAMALTALQKNQARNNISVRSGVGYSNIFANRPSATSIAVTADHVDLYDSSGNTYGAHGVSFTISAGTVGANGLDGGTLAATTAYNYFVIYNPATDTVAGLLSNVANGNNPAMPSGYIYKRRIGWCVTDGTPGIRLFLQRNASFSINNAPRVIASGGSGLVAFSIAPFVPPTVLKVRGYLNTNNNNAQINDDSGNIVIGLNAAPPNVCFWPWEFVYMGNGMVLFYSCSSSGGSAAITGWEDTL
jgi:hypothetical protein